MLRFSLSIVIFFLVPTLGFAAGSAHGEIPWPMLQAQTVNFILFICILVYVTRKPAAEHFAKFRNDFIEESGKAQKIVAQAEKQKKEIEDQISKLETTYTSRLDVSKKEALQLKNTMINEATEKAKKLIEDTQDSANQLFKSAEQSIRYKVLDNAAMIAKEDLVKKIDSKESNRLHGEFLEEITAGYL